MLLRQTDMLILLGLSWRLCFQLLHYLIFNNDKSFKYPSYYLYCLSFGLATCIFIFFELYWWLPTPSYNSLALEATLIVFIALVDISAHAHTHVKNWLTLSLGYWLAAMAKPTTAVILCSISLCYLSLFEFKKLKLNHIIVLFFATIGLISLSALVIDGSVYNFIERIQRGINLLNLLYQNDLFSFWSSFEFLPGEPTKILFFLLMTVIFLSTIISTYKEKFAINTLFFVVLFICFFICIDYYITPILSIPWPNVLILAIPFGSILALVMMLRGSLIERESLKFITWSICFILLPYLITLGTHIDPMAYAFRYGFFWILAILPLIGLLKKTPSIRLRVTMTTIIFGQLLTISLVQSSMEAPYRQTQSLRSQTRVIDIINTKGRITTHLTVSDMVANSIENLKKTAIDNGFSYGDPMIDFNGLSPAALYIIGASPIGAPWYTPFPTAGNPDFVLANLSDVPCNKLINAWVLLPIVGEGYNLNVLESFGIPQSAFQATQPFEASSAYELQAVQQLMKPIGKKKEILSKCIQIQKKQKIAQKVIHKLILGKTHSTANIVNQSSTYIQNNQLEQAIKLIKSGITINHTDAPLYNNLCFIYALQKKFVLASKTCQHALSIDPNFELAHNNLKWIMNEMVAKS